MIETMSKKNTEHVNELDFKVYYADTDSYGVVWHGAYVRWLEAGRVEFLNDCGISIDDLYDFKKIVLPVVEINIQYKNSARTSDEITVVTRLSELKPHYTLFSQTIKEKDGEKIFATATVKCVGVNEEGKIIRTLDKFFE